MLLDTIKTQLTTSLKGGDKESALTLRSLIATLHNEKIKKGSELTDEEIVKVLKSEVKKRDEALEAFVAAGREESAANERREKELFLSYMPKQLSEEEIEAVIADVLSTAEDKSNFGIIMKLVMEKAGPAADGGTIARLLKQKM